ncbi:zinc ribbon domain-containing protein [Nonomuraea sp. SYSU D8015]|uniref:zinc ribbon domain-containing protein n=1 Tax=Nonomuraea sp. SYSU D8015 TaxID=2593644 RepID=UPI001660C761|nr:zinc ribbon domain-containing protein [Nonomuraea sp. SYSU D8015]
MTKLKWNPQDQWVWSEMVVHEPIVDIETLEQAQALLSANGRPATARKPPSTRRSYVLRRLLHCGVCGRRMEGTWSNGRPYYRCKFPTEYALANMIVHPRTVYVREDHILTEVDPWVCQIFSPAALEQTAQALVDAQNNETDRVIAEAARKVIDDCDQRMTATGRPWTRVVTRKRSAGGWPTLGPSDSRPRDGRQTRALHADGPPPRL